MTDARKTRAAGAARGSKEPTGFKPFGRALRDLLIEREITTGTGNANWSAFAELLDGVHYETLRKAVTGERTVSPELMETVAAALNLKPADIFDEYRLCQAQRMFDPREVGSEEAMKNLARWAECLEQRR